MSVHEIQPEAGYKGAGLAWGAINAQGEVVSLVYLKDLPDLDLQAKTELLLKVNDAAGDGGWIARGMVSCWEFNTH